MDVKKVNVNEINAGVLAYLGDSVYELKIRNYLVLKKRCKANLLARESISYVSALNQANFLDVLISKNILTESELYTINRARNYKTNSKPKNTSIKIYKKATALEALFGMLYILGDDKRINEIMKVILGD